jgi:hypothetical protein
MGKVELTSFSTQFKQGSNLAHALFEPDGVTVKFERTDSEFTRKVGLIVDEFLHGENKNQASIQEFAIDVFEKNEY